VSCSGPCFGSIVRRRSGTSQSLSSHGSRQRRAPSMQYGLNCMPGKFSNVSFRHHSRRPNPSSSQMSNFGVSTDVRKTLPVRVQTETPDDRRGRQAQIANLPLVSAFNADGGQLPASVRAAANQIQQ
jgi:hypothetical protein